LQRLKDFEEHKNKAIFLCVEDVSLYL